LTFTLATASTRRSCQGDCQNEAVRTRPAAVVADLVAVLVFVLLGRRSHDEGSALAGTVATAWPFLTGAAAGEAVALVARRPPESVAAGAIVTAGAVGLGMILRRVAGGGTPVSFVLVATTFVALFVVGWRLAARLLARRRAVA
jgi:peptidoglycan/LPS O-acetylase OafA/YrhL